MSDDAQVQELAGRVTALQSEHLAQAQALTDRITASQSQNAHMKCDMLVLTQQIVKLQGDVERLETERQKLQGDVLVPKPKPPARRMVVPKPKPPDSASTSQPHESVKKRNTHRGRTSRRRRVAELRAAQASGITYG